jgi:hypothetical protein
VAQEEKEAACQLAGTRVAAEEVEVLQQQYDDAVEKLTEVEEQMQTLKRTAALHANDDEGKQVG